MTRVVCAICETNEEGMTRVVYSTTVHMQHLMWTAVDKHGRYYTYVFL